MSRITKLCILLAGSMQTYGWASTWPQFRGPMGNGVAQAVDIPMEWSAEQNVAWTRALPGAGWSSPVIARQRVWVTAAVHEGQARPKGFQEGVRSMGNFREASKNLKLTSFKVFCLDLNSGDILWESTPSETTPAFAIHPSNTYATETPVTDGKHVFAYFAAAGEVSCLGETGELLWKVKTGRHAFGNGFGSGSGLTLANNKLFLQCDNDEASYVMALDTRTGDEIWKQKRSSRTSWSTPMLWETGKGMDLVLAGSGHVTGYDLNTGGLRWKLKGLGGSFSGSPASDGTHLYFGNSGPRSTGPLVAISQAAQGERSFTPNRSEGWIAWSKSGAGPGLASPVAHEGFLYVINGSVLKCFEAQSGKRIYEERLPGASRVAASLWIAGESVFVLDEDGNTFVVRAGGRFELRRVNTLQDLFWATPSMVDNRLLLRGADNLYCISEGK